MNLFEMSLCLTLNINFASDDHTRSKFLFYGGPDCLHMKDGLEVYIDSKDIPDFLGGPCEVSVLKYSELFEESRTFSYRTFIVATYRVD